MNKKLFYCLKILISALVSASILLGISCIYYNVPVHFSNKESFTDYVWEQDKFYSRATEGFAYGKTNNEGLNNIDDYTGQDIDILFIGSSQFEAFNVSQKDSACAKLNEKFDNEYYAYNIGVSGHDFYACFQNFEAAMEKYTPKKYVIVECEDLFLSNENLEKAIDNSYPELYSADNKYIIMLEKIPLLRHYYNQFDNVLHSSGGVKAGNTEKPYEDISQNLDTVIEKMKKTADKYNTELIILNHQSLTKYSDKIAEQSKLWQDICTNNGVVFLNTNNYFFNSFKNGNYVYGFINTLPEEGHLNKNGNELIAQAIYDYIKGEEK